MLSEVIVLFLTYFPIQCSISNTDRAMSIAGYLLSISVYGGTMVILSCVSLYGTSPVIHGPDTQCNLGDLIMELGLNY